VEKKWMKVLFAHISKDFFIHAFNKVASQYAYFVLKNDIYLFI
jgi:hypothetical protein